ncbi:MAG: hypothetical protein M3395_03860 [Chloroflexota bacterium]|nr:hypothetical protein [Chloroflexota bacterium]
MDNKMGPGESASVRRGGEAIGDDEVEGHSMRAPKADEGGEDTEGHRFSVRAEGDEEDTEGHRFTAPKADEGDEDTEGHRMTAPKADEGDEDVEGHASRLK